jgi:hypothetical protein
MFEKNAIARHKNEHRVTVTLTGQEPFEAFVFLKVNERLIDLLNDQRLFIPVKRADGATLIVSKQNIVAIVEKADEPVVEPEAPAPEEEAKAPEAEAANEAKADDPDADKSQGAKGGEDFASRINRRGRRNFDPYEILRIAKDAGPEEIRKAYHQRMKAVHPDAIAALDLDEDLARAANISAQRVNRAYRILMREKDATAKAEETAA